MPHMAKRARPRRFSDEVRAAVEADGRPRSEIARATGLSESTLSRFMTGERGLTMNALDVLAAHLGLHVTKRTAEYSRNDESTKAQ